MNHKAMLELADHMEKMPAGQFDMMYYGHRMNERRKRANLESACGTTRCVAGEKVLLDGGEMRFYGCSIADFFINGAPVDAESYAREALDLTWPQKHSLFHDYSLSDGKQAASKIRRMVMEDQAGSR